MECCHHCGAEGPDKECPGCGVRLHELCAGADFFGDDGRCTLCTFPGAERQYCVLCNRPDEEEEVRLAKRVVAHTWSPVEEEEDATLVDDGIVEALRADPSHVFVESMQGTVNVDGVVYRSDPAVAHTWCMASMGLETAEDVRAFVAAKTKREHFAPHQLYQSSYGTHECSICHVTTGWTVPCLYLSSHSCCKKHDKDLAFHPSCAARRGPRQRYTVQNKSHPRRLLVGVACNKGLTEWRKSFLTKEQVPRASGLLGINTLLQTKEDESRPTKKKVNKRTQDQEALERRQNDLEAEVKQLKTMVERLTDTVRYLQEDPDS